MSVTTRNFQLKSKHMRIYYDVDTKFYETINEVTNICRHDCPFKDVGFKGETGGECKVGSVECQECKFCYGHHDSHRHSLVFIKNKAYLRTMPYVKCMWGLENTWREKIEQFFYRIKQWFK